MFMSESPPKKKHLERIARSFDGFVVDQNNEVKKSG